VVFLFEFVSDDCQKKKRICGIMTLIKIVQDTFLLIRLDIVYFSYFSPKFHKDGMESSHLPLRILPKSSRLKKTARFGDLKLQIKKTTRTPILSMD
jgi:hypothetical protein